MSVFAQAPSLPASSANLKRLVLLRAIALTAQVAAVLIAVIYYRLELPLLSIGVVLSVSALLAVFTGWRVRRHGPISHREFHLHLVSEVLALTAFLYFTGGATNPLAVLYLLPLVVAVTLLPAGYIWRLAAVTAVAYSLLMWRYVPLPQVHNDGGILSLHVTGMWIAFVLIAGLVAYFVAAMGKTLRAQEQALAAAREQRLRDDRLVAVGTLAASTAHELGTPLGTLALLAEELKEGGLAEDEAARAKLQIMCEQIDRCQGALSTLSASAGGVRLSGGRAVAVDRYLRQLFEEWRHNRPHVKVNTRWQSGGEAPVILADRTLAQALINILDNAADASPEQVEWEAAWDTGELVMEIRDRGEGICAEAEQKLGKLPYSSKSDGLGLGLFLAYAIIGRFGGSVKLFNRDGGGVCTRVRLPFHTLRPAVTP